MIAAGDWSAACRRKSLWIFSGYRWFAAKTILHTRESLWMFPGYWWFAAKTNLQAKKPLNFSRILMICGKDNSTGEKVFEFFQDIDDLRLRRICRRKSLWIFPGYWRFAAKAILQAKKSLNTSRILMICGWDNSAGKKIFEYFQDIDDLRLGQFCRRKNFRIFPGYWWFPAKTNLQFKKSLNISRILKICG